MAFREDELLQLYGNVPGLVPQSQYTAADTPTPAPPEVNESLIAPPRPSGFGGPARWIGLLLLVLAIFGLAIAAVALLVDVKKGLRTPGSPDTGIVYETIFDDLGNKFIKVTADVFCIGSGPAGAETCKLATDDGTTSAVILEAGPLLDEDRNITLGVYNRILLSLYWDLYGHPGKSRPTFSPARAMEMQTGRLVGGSSAINNMNAVWPSEAQMQALYVASGNSPLFTVANQKAALKRLEKFNPVGSANTARGTNGPYQITQVPRGGPLTYATKLLAAFSDVTGYGETTDYMLEDYGFTRTWQLFMDTDGKRSDSRTAFLNSNIVTETENGQLNGVDGRKLQLLTGAYVTKINFDTSSGVEPRATGVTFIRNGIPYIGVARKAIHDGAGFMSSHLLQVSGIGDKDVLAEAGIPLVKHLPNVGRKYKNHLALSWTFSKPSSDVATDPSNGNFTCTSGAFYPSPIYPSDPRRGVQFVFQDGLVNGGNNADPANVPPTPNPAALVITAFLLHPDSSGTIFPETPSIFDPPVINNNYIDPTTKDFQFFVNVSRIYIAPVGTYMAATYSGYAATNPNLAAIADDTQLNSYINTNIRHTHHGSGGTGMGPCAQGGVVDPLTGRVCGVRGLFSWNTQVLPIQSDGNHQFPTAMITDIFARNAIANDWYVNTPAA